MPAAGGPELQPQPDCRAALSQHGGESGMGLFTGTPREEKSALKKSKLMPDTAAHALIPGGRQIGDYEASLGHTMRFYFRNTKEKDLRGGGGGARL